MTTDTLDQIVDAMSHGERDVRDLRVGSPFVGAYRAAEQHGYSGEAFRAYCNAYVKATVQRWPNDIPLTPEGAISAS